MADLDNKKDVKNEKSEKKPAAANTSVNGKKKEKTPLMEKVKRFLREYKSELKKIVWYGPKQTAKSTVLVVITIVVAAACIGGFDFLFSNLLNILGRVI
jgi:preprotein translocase, SecE subunit, bacterial